MSTSGHTTSEQNVDQMISMGFPREAAIIALNKANNDVNAAVEMLINGPAVEYGTSSWDMPFNGSQSQADAITGWAFPAAEPRNNPASTAIIPTQVDSSLHTTPLPHPPLVSKEEEDLEKAMKASLETFNSPTTAIIPAVSKEEEDLNKAIEASLQGRDPNELEDPNTRLRAPTMPVGLKNIGNTCYLNSLLQTYFFVPRFRHAVLSFQAPAVAQHEQQQSWLSSSQPQQASIKLVQELQRLFGRLLLSERKEADPTAVIRSIVDAQNKPVEIGPQQDMSEFNGTLLTSLEHAFHPQPPPPEPLASQQHYSDYSHGVQDSDSAGLVPMHTSQADAVEETRQPNIIKTLFFGDMVEEYLAQEEDNTPTSTLKDAEFSHIILNVSAADLYRSLDEYSHAQIERYETPKHFVTKADKLVWFKRFPPVLIFQLQRVLYDMTKGAYKVHDRFAFQHEIYLDRYLYRNRDVALEKRRLMATLSEMKDRLDNQLRTYTHYAPCVPTSNPQPLPLDQALRASLQYVQGMLEMAPQDEQAYVTAVQVLQQSINLVDAHMQKLQAEIDEVVRQMDAVYADMRSTKYRLHSVWVHDGDAGGGHYWAFLYNNAAATWAKFSDANVITVDEETVFRESQGGYNRVSAYCLIYIEDSMLTFTNDAVQPFRLPSEVSSVPPQLRREIELENKTLQDEVRAWNEKREDQEVQAGATRFLDEWEKQVQLWKDAASSTSELDDLLLHGLEGFLVGSNEIQMMEYVVADRAYRTLFDKPFQNDAETQSELYRRIVQLRLTRLQQSNSVEGSAVEAWCSPTLHRQLPPLLKQCDAYNFFAQLHVNALYCIIDNNSTPMVDKLLYALRHFELAWDRAWSPANPLNGNALNLRFTAMMHDLRICIWALSEEARTMVSQGVEGGVRVSLIMAQLVRNFIKPDRESQGLYDKIVLDWSELAETETYKDRLAETIRVLLATLEDDQRPAQAHVQDTHDVNLSRMCNYRTYPPNPAQSLHNTYINTRKLFHKHSKIRTKHDQVRHFVHTSGAPPHLLRPLDPDFTSTPASAIGSDMMQIDSTPGPGPDPTLPSPSLVPVSLPTKYFHQPRSYGHGATTTSSSDHVFDNPALNAGSSTWCDTVERQPQSPDLMPGRANKRPLN